MSFVQSFKKFRGSREVWWTPLLTGGLLVSLHFFIETNLVAYWPSPREHTPFLIRVLFLGLCGSTFVLGVIIFPRWQSFGAFLLLLFVLLSISGR